MPPVLSLVSIAQLERLLGLEAGTDTDVLTDLAAGAEALFTAACRRTAAPFLAAAQAGRVERHDGTGTRTLWLDYAPSALISVVISWPHGEDETVDVADATVLRWRAGSARLVRMEYCRTFGCKGDPDAVTVTYDAAADSVPGESDASLAVARAVATMYRQLGTEDVTGERTGGYSSELARVCEGDPVWHAAVAAHRRVAF